MNVWVRQNSRGPIFLVGNAVQVPEPFGLAGFVRGGLARHGAH